MGNCLCIPKKHRNSGSVPEKEKNTGSFEEQRPNNGDLCEEISETFVSQAELPCEGPIIPEDNSSKCSIIYVCPTVSSSILLRYDDEDEEITTELAGGPNKCEATEQKAEPNDVTEKPSSSDDQVTKADQTTCPAVPVDSVSVAITADVDKNEAAEQKAEPNDVTKEPISSDDQVTKADQTTCPAASVDPVSGAETTEVDKHEAAEQKAESSDATPEPTAMDGLTSEADQMSCVDDAESKDVPQLSGSETTDYKDEPKIIQEPGSSKDKITTAESEVVTCEFAQQSNSEVTTQIPLNTAARLIEVREYKGNASDEPKSTDKKQTTEKITSFEPNVNKESGAKAYKIDNYETQTAPTKTIIQVKNSKESIDALSMTKEHSRVRGENVPCKKAADKSAAGRLSHGGLGECNKGVASIAPVRTINMEEVKSHSISGETTTATGQSSPDIDNKQTKHRGVIHSDVVINGSSNTKSTVSQQIGRFAVEPVNADGVQGYVTEQRKITGVADVETPTLELSIKGAMSSPAVPMKKHVSSHIKEFGALLNVLSALKIPHQKVTSDCNIAAPSNNKATSDDPITASTSKARVIGPQSDSSGKFGVYKSKQGIENWLQQSVSGTQSQRRGESNTSVGSTTKKVSDFDIPKKARKPPPAPLVLKKPSPHLYSIPAIAKSDPHNKVKWTQLEAKGPQTEVLWTTKPTAFNVKLPPLPKRLLERKGSVEKLQESWVLPQVKQIETLKRECGRFPGLVVPTPLRHKYSVDINSVDESSRENDDGVVDIIDKAKKQDGN